MQNKPIRLISENERLKIEIGASTFIYRRALGSTISQIRRAYTKGGEFDAEGFADEILEKHVLDWRDVLNERDEQVPFSPDKVKYLPDEVRAKLLGAINGISGELEKNWSHTP